MISKPLEPGILLEPVRAPELANPGEYLREIGTVLGRVPISGIEEAVEQLFRAYLQGRAIYIFGNGGSAALASHVACDLGKGTVVNGNRRLRVMSLTDNVALITAWANDVAYEDIFAAQLQPFLHPGDIALAISGSGNSPNVLKALSVSREGGAINVGLTGFQGGKMKDICDLCIVVPSDNMQHIEDSHVCVMHAIFLALRRLIAKAHLSATTESTNTARHGDSDRQLTATKQCSDAARRPRFR